MPTITFRNLAKPGDPPVYGFKDGQGHHVLPKVGKNQKTTLKLHNNTVGLIDSVTLEGFSAYTWPPTQHSQSWSTAVTLTHANPMQQLDLPTTNPDHRLIFFSVTVRLSKGATFTYFDPWDESPGAKGP